MKPLLILLTVIFSSTAFAQKIETYYDYRWKETTPDKARYLGIAEKTDSGWHKRDYFIHERVLQMDGTYDDSACKKPNGHFSYFHANGTLQSAGTYIHGKRDGLWVSYHYNGMMSDSASFINGHKTGASCKWYENGYPSDSSLWNPDGSGVSAGWFNNGNPSYAGRYGPGEKMQGKWMYFHRNGKPSATEMYEDGKLIDKQYYDEEGKSMDTVNRDRNAQFPGGLKGWQKYLNNQLYFPTQYKIVNGDKAIVVVEAIIDEEGNVTDATVSTPFHPAFDKIALQVIRKSPRWEPAISHNRKLPFKIKQPVAFAQQVM